MRLQFFECRLLADHQRAFGVCRDRAIDYEPNAGFARRGQGYIHRQPRAGDMRIRDVGITEEGRAAFEKNWPNMYDLLLKMIEGIDEKEYRAFTATLHKVLSNIHKHDL